MKKNGTKPEKTLKMDELCQITGLSRTTIYKYMRMGILSPPYKDGPTKLRYDDSHIKQLEKIRHLRKNKKLSISEIENLIRPEIPEENDSQDSLRELIVDVAMELFSRNGFAETKISAITEKLNLGKGTFYLYFKNKDDLFLECIERFPEIILPKNTWEEIRKEKAYFRRIYKRLDIMLKTFPTFMGIISIAKFFLRSDDPEMFNKAKASFKTIESPLSKDIKKAMKNGEVRELDQDFISFLLFGLGESVGYWLMMNSDYTIEECTDMLLDFIAFGLKPIKNDNHKKS